MPGRSPLFWSSVNSPAHQGQDPQQMARFLTTVITNFYRKRYRNTVRVLSHSVVPDSCDHVDCSRPGSPLHGIFQARILEWAVSSSSSFLPQGLNPPLPLAGRFFTTEPPGEAREMHTHPLTVSRYSVKARQALQFESSVKCAGMF